MLVGHQPVAEGRVGGDAAAEVVQVEADGGGDVEPGLAAGAEVGGAGEDIVRVGRGHGRPPGAGW